MTTTNDLIEALCRMALVAVLTKALLLLLSSNPIGWNKCYQKPETSARFYYYFSLYHNLHESSVTIDIDYVPPMN